MNTNGVMWTLLLPLMSRARITKTYSFLLNDPKAVELVELLSGKLSVNVDPRILYTDLGNAARARNFDDEVKAFIQDRPNATIVNLGSGFDTAFSRIDNGTITWFDIDFPEVVEMRRLVVPETARCRCIACSILDKKWLLEIGPAANGVLFLAGGVMPYFARSDVKTVFSLLADNYPSGEFVFDAVSWLGKILSNQRIKKAGISSASMKWAFGRNGNLRRLEKRIIIRKQYAMFANIERSSAFEKGMVRIMDRCDAWNTMNMVHCAFGM